MPEQGDSVPSMPALLPARTIVKPSLFGGSRRLVLELPTRTASNNPSHLEPIREDEERKRFISIKRNNGGLLLPKKPKESLTESARQRKDPYEEFFILTS